jgi:hypothetical protein
MTNFGNVTLNEEELRSIIRRRLIAEELRYSHAQKLVLFEQSQGGAGITSGTINMLAGIADTLNPLSDEDMAKYIPWAFDAASALLTAAGATTAAALMPGGLILKTYAFAKIGFYGYTMHKYLIKPFAEDASDVYKAHEVFIGTKRASTKDENYINEKVDGLATLIDNKELKMPRLDSNFEAINNLGPNSSKAEYEAAIKGQENGDDPKDWLGIPLDKFKVDYSPGFQRILAFTNPNSGDISGKHAKEIVDVALKEQDPNKVIGKLAQVSKNYCLRDFQRLDYFVGVELLKRIKEGKADFAGDGNFAKRSLGGYHFDCTQKEMEGLITNKDKGRSVIYGMCMNFNTASKNIFTMGGTGFNYNNDGIDKINDMIESRINFSDLYWPDRFMTINGNHISQGDFIQNIAPYMGGIDRIDPGSYKVVGKTVYLGKRFFDQLEQSLLEQLKSLASSIYDYIKELWDKFKPTGEAIIAGGLSMLSDAWDTLKSVWERLVNGELSIIDITKNTIESAFKSLNELVKAIINYFKDFSINTSGGESNDGQSNSGAGKKQSKRSGGRKVRGNVQRMQRLLNLYIEREGMEDSPTDVDGVWGGDTDRVWQAVINREFAEGMFKDDPDASIFSRGLTKWPTMSKKLNDETGPQYPDYTPDADGALKIIQDIFEKRIGDTGGGRTGGDTNAGAGSESSRGIGARDNRGTRGDGGTLQRNNIGIEVLAGNNSYDTLEQVGFNEGTSKNVSDVVITSIKSMNHTGGMVTLKVRYSRRKTARYEKGEVTAIRAEATQKVMKLLNYKALRRSLMKLMTSPNSRVDLGKMDRKESGSKGEFTLVLRIPPGAKRF